MADANQAPMTVDEFLAWAEEQEGRYELFNGQVYAMAPERSAHALTKFAVQTALADGIRRAGLLVSIVVEVLSPSTRRIDASRKLAGYFRLPSVHHYLIVDPESLPVIHHQRRGDGTILTRLLSEGSLHFEPPGFEMAVGQLLG
jgi:Uma2 family endonuclease